MFFKIGILKNFATLTGKHLCWGFLINLQACRCFFVNIAKFLRTASFTEHLVDASELLMFYLK